MYASASRQNEGMKVMCVCVCVCSNVLFPRRCFLHTIAAVKSASRTLENTIWKTALALPTVYEKVAHVLF